MPPHESLMGEASVAAGKYFGMLLRAERPYNSLSCSFNHPATARGFNLLELPMLRMKQNMGGSPRFVTWWLMKQSIEGSPKYATGWLMSKARAGWLAAWTRHKVHAIKEINKSARDSENTIVYRMIYKARCISLLIYQSHA